MDRRTRGANITDPKTQTPAVDRGIDLSRGLDLQRVESAITWAQQAYARCDVCAERCHVNRLAGELGRCGLGEQARVYKEYVHFGEESVFTPSHTVYLAGCSMRCAFCSDHGPVWSPSAHGVELPPAALAKRIAQRRGEGATNVNFVGGVPDTSILFILRTLALCPADTHVVFNTNLWSTPAAIDALTGIVGTWLIDLKFGPGRCGKKLAQVDRYWETITPLLAGIADTEQIVVRHLVMPGHLDCCTIPAIDWLERYRPQAAFNLMTGYHPYKMAGHRSGMGRSLSKEERLRSHQVLSRSSLPHRMLDGRWLDTAE